MSPAARRSSRKPRPAAAPSPFDAAFLDARKIDLLARRAKHAAELAAAPELPDTGLADSDIHLVAEALERIAATSGSDATAIAEIEAALARIDEGTYGRCESCREPIVAERLELVPTARTCVPHAPRRR